MNGSPVGPSARELATRRGAVDGEAALLVVPAVLMPTVAQPQPSPLAVVRAQLALSTHQTAHPDRPARLPNQRSGAAVQSAKHRRIFRRQRAP